MGEPLYEKISRLVRQKISNQEFPVGTKLPTEVEMAQTLGVSRITVHRALQHLSKEGLITRYPGKGTFVTKDTFHETPNSLSISPHLSKEAALIGCILPSVSEDYGLQLLTSIIQTAESMGYAVLVSITHQSQQQEQKSIDTLLRAGAAGLIVDPVNGCYYNDTLLRLHLSRFPMVLIDKRLDKIAVPSVTSDNHGAAFELTRHLIRMGHRRIGFITPCINATATLEDRLAGHMAALEAEDIPYDQQFTLATLPTGGALNTDNRTETYAAIRNYLRTQKSITAVVVTEYLYAVMVHEICDEIGISVPTQLSIACFDNLDRAGTKMFTHIEQNQCEMAGAAVHILTELMGGVPQSTARQIELPATLVPGHTCAVPQAKDN